MQYTNRIAAYVGAFHRSNAKHCPRASAFQLETLESRRLLSSSVLSWRNDAAQDGRNLTETTLTPTNVGSSNFGLLSTLPLDGQVYAQPLVATNINITTGVHAGTQSVTYVATENNSVYAFNASTGALLWKTSVNDGGKAVPTSDLHTTDITVQAGITSTPVIDSATGCIYVVDSTLTTIAGNQHFKITLHALNLGNGTEAEGGPKLIADTICNDPTSSSPAYQVVSGPTVNGTGVESSGGVVQFNAVTCNQRSALQIVKGTLYIANSSHSDFGPYHGWVLGYSPTNLAQTAVFNDTPNGSDGGIWMSGGGISADASGDLFLTVGNGTFDTTLDAAGFPSKGDYGEALLKLTPDSSTSPTHENVNGWGLKVADYFVPTNQANLTTADLDMSTTALLLPSTVGSSAAPNLVVFADKGGNVYVDNADNLGHFNSTKDNIVQEFNISGGFYSNPAYFNGHLYLTARSGKTLELSIANGHVNTTPVSSSSAAFGFPGASASISANGSSNGIVWEINHSTNSLVAYSASSLTTALFNASIGSSNKFTPATVANGMVYAVSTNALNIYGLKNPAQPVADGIYTLKNAFSGLVLDDPAASKTVGAQMIQYAANGGSNQKWKFTFNGAGYYTITNVASGLVLDNPSNSSSGVKLQQYTANGGTNQLWSLTPLDGGYIIQNKRTGLVIDDTGSSTASGSRVDLNTNQMAAWQAWQFS